MRSLTLQAALVTSLLCLGAAACGDKPAQPQPSSHPAPTQPPTPPPSAKPSASATASAAPSASSALSAIPIPSAGPSGPVKWADFGGPEVKSPVKEGQKAWAAIPVSAGWDTLKLSLHEVSRIEGETVVVFSIDGVDYFVPAAFVVPAEPAKDLAMGDAVMASAYGTRVFGRVTALTPKLKVKFRFAVAVEEKEFDASEVSKLDATLHFGAPILFKEEREGVLSKDAKLRTGQFVSTDEGRTWVLGLAGKPQRVAANAVQPMDVRQHKVNDKVWVTRSDEVTPGLVQEVLDDGVRYRVKLENGDEATATLDQVTVPLSGVTLPPAPTGSSTPNDPQH